MAIKPSKRLQTVLRLAKLKEQRAAESLANSIREVAAHEQQQQQLEQYKVEYGDQFYRSLEGALTAGQLANFQRFYNELEFAGETQQERRVLAEEQQELARQQWQQQYARQKNMEALIERKEQLEQREEDNKLQREQDDRPFKRPE